jgi:hypothetical protein
MLRDELLALHDKNGLFVPQSAVQWARKNKNSALHRALEWDNEKAGEEFRIWQVRRLVAIHIVSQEGHRQFISLSIDRVNPGGGYRDLETVMKAPQLREIALQDAFNDLARLQAKYEHLQELAKVWEELERAKKRRKAA